MEKIQRPGNTHSIFTTSMSIVKVLPCSSIIQCFQDFDLSILQAQNRYSKAHFGCMYQMYLNDSRVHSFISHDDKRVLFILEKCWARNAVLHYSLHTCIDYFMHIHQRTNDLAYTDTLSFIYFPASHLLSDWLYRIFLSKYPFRPFRREIVYVKVYNTDFLLTLSVLQPKTLIIID